MPKPDRNDHIAHAAPRELSDEELHEAYIAGHMTEALYRSQCHLRFASRVTHFWNESSRQTFPPSNGNRRATRSREPGTTSRRHAA